MMTNRRLFHHFAATVTAAILLSAVAADRLLAAGELVLRSNITVSSDIVRIGDLFDNAAGAADVPIFRSPSPGRSGFLTARRVSYAVRNFGLDWNNPYRISEIAVYRDGRQIPLSEIEDAIKARIEQLDANKQAADLDLAFDTTPAPFIVPSNAGDEITLLHADFEARSGRFVAVITTSGKSAGTIQRKFTGRAIDVVSAPILSRSVARGGRITGEDVTMTRMPRSSVPTNALFESSDVVGMIATRPLHSGAVVRARDVERPRVVGKSELVTVVYIVPGLQLTAKAQALESGSKGDVVTIMNPRSKRVFEAVVTGPGTVSAVLSAPRHTAGLGQWPEDARSESCHDKCRGVHQ
jgi:flagella basal body P-ring formation protein FlgA